MLPVDFLKIDRDFVQGLGVEASDGAIVQALATLARAFGLELIAEGVEGTAAIPELLAIGCVRAQGNMLSPALPPEELRALLAAPEKPWSRLLSAAGTSG
jgi:EAL domain-containing protein (putative c-di-GMP-specific phosphodiesterase class I)